MLPCAGDIELGELASILIQHEALGGANFNISAL
jgi:hypothetical protein